MKNLTEIQTPIRILLVDDHQVVRHGTRDLLQKHPKIDVVGDLPNGEELMELLRLRTPDILLLDINLPGKNGLQLLEELRPLFPNLKIILFSAYSDIGYIKKAQQLQTDGYLSKTIGEEELHQALAKAISGEGPVYSSDILPLLEKANDKTQTSGLTPREQEILMEVAQGQTNLAIAQKLCVSVKTVDSHVANLMKKLGVNRRTQLATLAIEQGLV